MKLKSMERVCIVDRKLLLHELLKQTKKKRYWLTPALVSWTEQTGIEIMWSRAAGKVETSTQEFPVTKKNYQGKQLFVEAT